VLAKFIIALRCTCESHHLA